MTTCLEERKLWIQTCKTPLKNWPCVTFYSWCRGWVDKYVILPSGCPEYINFLKPILFIARDSSSGFRQGYHTFLYGHKKHNRGSGRKRTNEQYGLRSAPNARRVVLWYFFVQLFVHFVDYHWECIFRENSTKLFRTDNSSWLVPSAVRSRLPLCVSLRQLTLSGFLCQLSSLVFLGPPFPPPLPVSSEISSPSPLFGFTPKQTKGSSIWRTTHIVSHIKESLLVSWSIFSLRSLFRMKGLHPLLSKLHI